MFKLERRFLEWTERHLRLIMLIAFCVIGILIRWPLREFVSGDARFFLLPWYDKIKETGLTKQVGDYNLMYQALIGCMTQLPIKPLYAYKILSILFDYVLAASTAFLTGVFAKEDKKWKQTIVFGIVLLSPLVVLNSAAWAQCDSIYVCFAVLSLLALCKERYVWAMLLLGVSFSFKLQAVFLLPVFLFVYYSRRQFSVFLFLLIPLAMCLACLPSIFFGRNLAEVFLIYFKQTSRYYGMALNYPSVWVLLAEGDSSLAYWKLRVPAMIITVVALAMLMVYCLRSKIQMKGKNLLSMAFLLCFTCVIFLPSMHERYGYLYEILAIVLAVLIPQTAPLCAGLMVVTICTYGNYLFYYDGIPITALAVANLLIYGAYIWVLNKNMERLPAYEDEIQPIAS